MNPFQIKRYLGTLKDYAGMPILPVPGYKWITTDANGTVCVHTSKPFINETEAGFSSAGAWQVVASVKNHSGNWRNSLAKISKLPKLTAIAGVI